MIVRYFLVTLGLFLGLTACSGGKDTGTDDTDPAGDDDDDDDDDDVSPESGDSGGGGGQYFDAHWFLVDANFTYDSTTQNLVNATSPYGDVEPVIGLYFGEEAWQAQNFDPGSDAYCAIILPLTDASLGGWVAGAGMWYGFDYDPAAGALSDCNQEPYLFDPALFPDPINDFGVNGGWGVGVGEIPAEYVADYSTLETFDRLLGAYMPNAILPEPEGVRAYLGYAYRVDANYALIIDGDGYLTGIPSAEVNLGGNITTAYYRVFSRYVWSFN